MSGARVLEFVAREIRGRILTASSLTAFVAAERAADRLSMTATSREAAELAVLLPRTPLERVCGEFGAQTADIVKAIRPKGPSSGIAAEAMELHGRSEGDEVRKDAAIAAIAAEAAVASSEDREQMAEWLESMADLESDTERRAFLVELGSKLPEPGPTNLEGESSGQTRMLSISMDICGSTEAKARMKACARNDEELARWYAELHREFLWREWRFYSLLFGDGCSGMDWDWKHAFVVKGIGDEIWLLYKVSEDDLWKLGSLVARLLHAGLEVAGRPIRWTSAPDDTELPIDGNWETRHLPLKFYVDILDDAFEVSGPRREFVAQHLSEILGPEECWNGEDFIELGLRLHAGNLLDDGRRLIASIRTDYIGWEVDRFFRATKFALPCVVAVGKALFERTFGLPQHPDEHVGGTGLMKTVLRCPGREGGPDRHEHCFRYVKEDVLSKDLKGVGEGYAVYRMLRDNDVLGLRHTGADEKIMEETLGIFTPEMEHAERARGKGWRQGSGVAEAAMKGAEA